MTKTIQSVLKSMGRSPVKSVLTLLTVGLGVGVLIFALSISSAFTSLMRNQLENEGIVVTVANAEYNDEGMLEQVRPPQIGADVMDILSSDVPGVTAVTPLVPSFMSEYAVGNDVYRIRGVVGSNEQYVDVMSLRMVAGSPFTAADVEEGVKTALISESLAEILFGSPQDALGGALQPPAIVMGGGQGGGGGFAQRRRVMPTFTVGGVYADPGELQRTSYAVADMIVPYTGMLPAGVNARQAMRFLSGTVVMKVQGANLETVEAQVREALGREYGDGLILEVWEGRPNGEDATLQEARNTVSVFALVVNLLGFVLLVTGSIGILSIMLVEVLGRSKEIALERALGASKNLITREFFTRSLVLAGAAALVGVILSVVFAGPLKELVIPIFAGVTSADLSGSVITPVAIATGVVSALVVGGIFGVFPVFSALKTNIAEGMREA